MLVIGSCDRPAIDSDRPEEAAMQMRSFGTVIFCSVIVGAAFGCAQQPTAPTAVLSTAEASSAGATPRGSSLQTSAVAPARFGDRTPGVVFVTSQGLYYDTFVVKDPLPMKGRF